ncbi:MAG: PAS domain S-box protein [Verrucomicrobiota bacterium]
MKTVDAQSHYGGAALDDSQLQRLQGELKTAEAKYRKLYECMSDAFVSVDMSGRIQEFNEVYRSMLGYDREELMNLRYEDLTPAKWHSMEAEIVEKQILTRGSSKVYEKEYRRKDGSVFPVKLRTFLIRNEAEEPSLMWAIVRDVTARKQEREELMASEALSVSIRDSLNETLAVLDGHGVIIAVNEAWRRFANENDAPDLAANSLGINYLTVCQKSAGCLHGEEAEMIRDGIQSVLDGSLEDFSMEYPCDSPTKRRWFQMRINPLRGSRKGAVVAHLDITERKQIENREHWHNRILEGITSGMSLESILDLLVQSIESEDSELLCSVLLLDDEGKHLLHGSAPSLPAFYNHAIDGVAIGDGVGSCGTAAYTASRVIVEDIHTHPYWVNYKALAQKAGLRSAWSEPILSTKGQVLGTFAIYHRIPSTPNEGQATLITYAASLASIAIERKKVEKALVQAKILAETASAAKSRFLAILSHELRTPLNPMMMLVYGWQKNPDFPKKFLPDLKVLQQSIDTELALINDLLDVTAIDHAKVKFSFELLDVENLLTSTIHIVESEHPEKNIRIITDFEADRTMVNTDATKLQQVFWNLLRNALKFTPGGTVTVKTRNEDNRLRIDISDTGIGIRSEMLPRIFEPFEQGDLGHCEFGGLGLGLVIAKGMIEAMGGIILASSPGLGCGSTFSVLLDTAND